MASELLPELQAAKKLSIWDTMVLAVLIMETAVSVPGLCQLESKKIICLCDELLFLSYTLCKTLALIALRPLRTLSVSNSGYYWALLPSVSSQPQECHQLQELLLRKKLSGDKSLGYQYCCTNKTADR